MEAVEIERDLLEQANNVMKIDHYLMTVIASVIAVRTSQKLIKKL